MVWIYLHRFEYTVPNFSILISHIDHWCYPSCRWHLGQGEPGELFLPFKWEGHQCSLRAHWHRHCHHSFGHLWLFCYLPSFCVDAKTGESFFSLEVILGFWKVLGMFVGFVSWNWPCPFNIFLVLYENLPSWAASYHFCCAFPVLLNKKHADWTSHCFPLTPFASVMCLIYADLDFSFYPAVCNVSDSHIFGWIGCCHRRICFQTWGKPEFERKMD